MKHPLFVSAFTFIYVYGTFRIYKEVFNISKEHRNIAFKCFGK